MENDNSVKKQEELLSKSIFNKEKQVSQANILVRSQQDPMTSLEFKLTRLVIAQVINRDSLEFSYKMRVTALSKFLGVPKSNIFRACRKEDPGPQKKKDKDDLDLATSLLKKVIYIEENDKDKKGNIRYKKFQWFSSVEYSDGEITMTLNSALAPYLIELKKSFTSYDYSQIMNLPTTVSARLFEILWSFLNMKTPAHYNNIQLEKGEVYFTVSELRHMLGYENKYPNYANFEKRVIQPAVDAIRSNLMFPVTYRGIREDNRGREYSAIIFKLGDYKTLFAPYENMENDIQEMD